MIQILEIQHNERHYWVLMEYNNIIGEYSTRDEALRAAQQYYPELDGCIVIPKQSQ